MERRSRRGHRGFATRAHLAQIVTVRIVEQYVCGELRALSAGAHEHVEVARKQALLGGRRLARIDALHQLHTLLERARGAPDVRGSDDLHACAV
jgi:hypothetical protein